MIKKFKIAAILFFFGIQLDAQDWRNEYVKFSIGSSYSIGILPKGTDSPKTNFNKFSGVLSVDVTLSENDVYDASNLYLQLYAEGSLPVQHPGNDRLKLHHYSGGVNLKKHFNPGNLKTPFYLLAGARWDFVIWKLQYPNHQRYTNTNTDLLLNVGTGFIVNRRIEVYANYSKGFNKVYAIRNLDERSTIQYITFGVKFGFTNSWWFR